MSAPSSSKQESSVKDESLKSSKKKAESSRPHPPRKEEPTRELSCIESGPECLGRSVLSWIFSAIYLICLWTVLAAIFLGCLWLLCKSLEDGPRFYGGKSFIGGDSRIQIRNWAEIRKEYTKNLETGDSKELREKKTRLCKGGEATDDQRQCRVDDADFGEKCNPRNHEAAHFNRCFAVRLNHILGFVPELTTNKSSNAVQFSCTTNMTQHGALEMSPLDGIDMEHWNYNYSVDARKWYEQPVVSLYVPLKFTGALNITCTANVKNISPKSTSIIVTLPGVVKDLTTPKTNNSTQTTPKTNNSTQPAKDA